MIHIAINKRKMSVPKDHPVYVKYSRGKKNTVAIVCDKSRDKLIAVVKIGGIAKQSLSESRTLAEWRPRADCMVNFIFEAFKSVNIYVFQLIETRNKTYLETVLNFLNRR